jgi:hypothetical protein
MKDKLQEGSRDMKRACLGLTVAIVLALTVVPAAQASSLLSLTVSGTTATCDNSTAAGVTACLAAGFSTSLGASGVNAITFTNQTVNGVLFGNVSLGSNNPGSPTIAFVLDSKGDVRNNSGASRTLTVDFAINNFTAPVGNAFLSASQTANWTTSTAGDSQAFTAWERNTNDLVVPGPAGSAATTANCVSTGGLTSPCAQQSATDTAVTVTAPFALTGREVINMSAGTVANYSGTSTLSATPLQTPEPSSILLLTTGMVFLVGRKRWGRNS